MSDRLLSGGIAAGTGTMGLVGWIEMIPTGISKVACLVGIIFTIISGAVIIKKSIDDAMLARLEIRKLKLEIQDREC